MGQFSVATSPQTGSGLSGNQHIIPAYAEITPESVHPLGGISPDTLLRLVRRLLLPPEPTPRVVGVDDWALCKGQTYGTVLVDLRRRRPLDLLAGRGAGGLADWLRRHPGVRVITRDRSTEYARGASAGAPQVRQVADR
ncbi:transposase [Roseomonas sp. E05]|uniref:transposase n=1 Tax=Roseomonas sp. E05 TaxID=3046310 RepID=UPI0024BB115C|nr:transposase [Roseomonas sp. E05]MDJ0391582.1 transposase [Roseomonas sp. E05]